jgi:divalent metal cation (Fe/Co/Zn/Cd) transporter
MIEFTFSWVAILTLLVSTILPILVGLVTKVVTSAAKKATLLALLSAATGLGSELLNALTSHTAYDLFVGLVTFVTVFIVGVALHYGFWKPTGVALAAQKVGDSGN